MTEPTQDPDIDTEPADANESGENPIKRFTPIRWSLARASSEFGINPKTIAKRVKASGTLAGEDGHWSTAQIHAAICGDYERQRTRKMTEDADAQALSNARERERLVDKGDLLRRMEPIYVAIKEAILNSSMSENEKDATLNHIASLHGL